MQTEESLERFRLAYAAARYQSQRLEAIRRLRAALPDPPADPDLQVLRPILKALLHHAGTDGVDGRLAAARLFRYLWRGLSPAAIDSLLFDLTLEFLAAGPPIFTGERRVVLDAIDGGFAVASPLLVERLCLAITAREATRCQLSLMASGIWTPFEPPPVPSFDVLRLVARRAPSSLWPRLVRDLWQLYNLDTDPAAMLTFGELLARRRTEAGARYRRYYDRGSRAAHLGQWRRSFDGRHVGLEYCGDIAQRMLRRTLHEAAPEDLRDAAPGFFAWLEELAGMPEEALEPLLKPMAVWTVPAMARVFERWSAAPYSREFRRKAADAARHVRSALGAEVVPADAPHGDGREPSPAAASPGTGQEPSPAAGAGEPAGEEHPRTIPFIAKILFYI